MFGFAKALMPNSPRSQETRRCEPAVGRNPLQARLALACLTFPASYGFKSWNTPTLSPLGGKLCGPGYNAGINTPPKDVAHRIAAHAPPTIPGITDVSSGDATTKCVY
jgi:hypothetical protein